jgi:hypothetical protein
MEQIMSSPILTVVLWAGVGVLALVLVVWILRWVLGVNEILNALHAIRDELQVLRDQQVGARPSSAPKPDAARSDVPPTEPSPLDIPIPEDWRLGRQDKK